MYTTVKPEPKKQTVSSSSSTPTVSPLQSAPKFTKVPVNVKRSQKLIDPGQKTEKTYSWDSAFTIYVHESPAPWIQVVVSIETTADKETFEGWNERIKSAWNDKFAITSRRTGVVYPIRVQIIRPTEKWPKHYTVDVVHQEKALGIRGLMGTEHMTKWGAHDPQDIPHEFGHMLGNKDEYGTVDDVDWTAKRDILDTSTRSIMYKGDEPVRERHFELIAEQVKTVLGDDVGVTKIVPKQPSVSVLNLPLRMLPVTAKKTEVSPVISTPKKTQPSQPNVTSKLSSSVTAPKQLVSSSSSPISLSGGHAARVEKITEYLLTFAKIKKSTGEWLSTHDWNNNPVHSDTAMNLLGLKL